MRRFVFSLLLVSTLAAQAQDSAANSAARPVELAPAVAAPVEQPSEAVLAAEAAIAKADWKTAEEKLSPWLAAHATDARALFDAGYIADAQNRLEDAVSFYRRAIQANANSFEAHLSLGLLLARTGKQDEAHEQLLAATKLDAAAAGSELKARAWRALARIDLDRTAHGTDLTLASNDLIEALKLSRETPDDTLMAADIALRAGQPAQAEAAYHRLLATDPQSWAARSGLAHLFITQKKFAEAEELLRAALTDDPKNPALIAQLASVLAAQDKPEALDLLEKLHAEHPSDPAITKMLAEVLTTAGDTAGADKLLLSLLAASPNDADLLILHGQNLVRLGRFPVAYSTFDKATHLAPGNADAWSGLAFAASRANRPDTALHALEARAKLAPENASTYFLRATAYDALRQKSQAIAYYHRFLEASAGKFATQEWQAKQRLQLLEK